MSALKSHLHALATRTHVDYNISAVAKLGFNFGPYIHVHVHVHQSS